MPLQFCDFPLPQLLFPNLRRRKPTIPSNKSEGDIWDGQVDSNAATLGKTATQRTLFSGVHTYSRFHNLGTKDILKTGFPIEQVMDSSCGSRNEKGRTEPCVSLELFHPSVWDKCVVGIEGLEEVGTQTFKGVETNNTWPPFSLPPSPQQEKLPQVRPR